MPILDRMLKTQTGDPGLDEMVALAWDSVKVRADVAADLYWQSPQEVWLPDKDYPPMRLPYPHMWIEWEQPRKWLSGKRVVSQDDPLFDTQMGILLSDLEIPNDRVLFNTSEFNVAAPRKAHSAIQFHAFGMKAGRAIVFPFMGLVYLGEAGRQIMQVQYLGPDSHTTVSMLDPKIQPGLLAVGLMNCRNVTINEVTSPVPIGRKQRRRNPGVTYRTINVPGHAGGETSNNGMRGPGVAMHRVRGHFKTFTSERPLLGQHVGTYWWGWQVRGKAELGTVVSDYRIGASS